MNDMHVTSCHKPCGCHTSPVPTSVLLDDGSKRNVARTPLHNYRQPALAPDIVFCPLHAAAPDLLALAQRVAEAPNCECFWAPDYICMRCEARAAIAKARGE